MNIFDNCRALILAAGKGTRLATKDDPSPKVLRRANGRPLLAYVLDSTDGMPRENITIIVGYMADMVKEAFADSGCNFALQGTAAYGTGYAVMCGAEAAGLADFDGDVIILQGDVPLVKAETVRALLKTHREKGSVCTLLSCRTPLKLPFGRIVRDDSGKVTAIVEDKDCTPEQKKIDELNVGLYVYKSREMCEYLGKLKNDNKAGEYYFTDIPGMLIADGKPVEAHITPDQTELWGVNTFEDLREVERILASRK